MTTMEWLSIIAALASGIGGVMLGIGVLKGQIQAEREEQKQHRKETHDRLLEQQRRIDDLIRERNKRE